MGSVYKTLTHRTAAAELMAEEERTAHAKRAAWTQVWTATRQYNTSGSHSARPGSASSSATSTALASRNGSTPR